MNTDHVVREQLAALLRGGQAYMPLDQAVVDFPMDQINRRPPNVPYTFWHLLEHLRIAQWDILEFIRNLAHVSPPWPNGYWPPRDADADAEVREHTIAAFRADHEALVTLVHDPATKLYAPLPHAPECTILREILMVADHNAYHTGEFVILRQVMGTWPA